MKVRPCIRCGRDMVPGRRWRASSELRAAYRPHHARGLCESCYVLVGRCGDRIDYERPNRDVDEVLDEWVVLRGEGHTVPAAAARLGMSLSALSSALVRARESGDPRARFDWRGVHEARATRPVKPLARDWASTDECPLQQGESA